MSSSLLYFQFVLSFCVTGGPRPVVPDAVPAVPARHRLGGVQSHVGAGGGPRLPFRVRGSLCFLGLPPILRPPVSPRVLVLLEELLISLELELACESSQVLVLPLAHLLSRLNT